VTAELQLVTTTAAVGTRDLNAIAKSVHKNIERGKRAYADTHDALFAIGRDLLEARERLASNQAFGKWFSEQQFGFTPQWAGVLRRAAEHEPQVRRALETQVSDGSAPNIKEALAAVRNPERAAAEPKSQAGPTGPHLQEYFARWIADWHKKHGRRPTRRAELVHLSLLITVRYPGIELIDTKTGERVGVEASTGTPRNYDEEIKKLRQRGGL
jgi:hypothetical protein